MDHPSGEGQGEQLHWYNPKRRVAETVVAPYTDEEAEYMLWGATDSWAFLREYERLRDEGMGIEETMIFVGQRFSMWHVRNEPEG